MSDDANETPLSIDDMSDILLPVTKAIATLVEQLESLVTANCRSSNISEESAELLAEVGNTALRHSRTLVREVNKRRSEGKGSRLLASHRN